MKHKDVFITLMVVGGIILTICLGVGYFYMNELSAERDRAERLAFYKRDDCSINIIATITRVEHNENNAYRLCLQYDEQISDFRFAEYFSLIPSNVDELQKNGFDFTQLDKQYTFSIGRRKLYRESQGYPIIEIREVEEGGKVYLDYEMGKSNILLFISS